MAVDACLVRYAESRACSAICSAAEAVRLERQSCLAGQTVPWTRPVASLAEGVTRKAPAAVKVVVGGTGETGSLAWTAARETERRAGSALVGVLADVVEAEVAISLTESSDCSSVGRVGLEGVGYQRMACDAGRAVVGRRPVAGETLSVADRAKTCGPVEERANHTLGLAFGFRGHHFEVGFAGGAVEPGRPSSGGTGVVKRKTHLRAIEKVAVKARCALLSHRAVCLTSLAVHATGQAIVSSRVQVFERFASSSAGLSGTIEFVACKTASALSC